jgi:hypothetical protein
MAEPFHAQEEVHGNSTTHTQVLSAAQPTSLVLLDEVGSGTDPVEGVCIASASQYGMESPKVAAMRNSSDGLLHSV